MGRALTVSTVSEEAGHRPQDGFCAERGPCSLVLRLVVGFPNQLDSVHLEAEPWSQGRWRTPREPGEVEDSPGRELLEGAGEGEQNWKGRKGRASGVL